MNENLYFMIYSFYSWDEMAQYDVPAFINYILNVTNHSKLNYIGHSMGKSSSSISSI